MGSRCLLLVLVLLAAACSRTTLKGTVAAAHAGDELDFWDGLSEARAVTNHDAMHALLLAFTDKAPAGFAAHLGEAKRRHWVSEELEPNQTARVGWIAKAVCIEAKIKGGLTMRLLGAKERYAVRELNYKGWLSSMSKNQALSGLQLIALLSKVEDSQADGPDRPREDLK